MSDDKWIMFKNYMHNELGITQQDIRQWIKESVEETAKRMVSNEFDNFDPRQTIKNIIMTDDYFTGKRLRDDIKEEIVEKLTDRLILKLRKWYVWKNW